MSLPRSLQIVEAESLMAIIRGRGKVSLEELYDDAAELGLKRNETRAALDQLLATGQVIAETRPWLVILRAADVELIPA